MASISSQLALTIRLARSNSEIVKGIQAFKYNPLAESDGPPDRRRRLLREVARLAVQREDPW